jgi:hypothetical protein
MQSIGFQNQQIAPPQSPMQQAMAQPLQAGQTPQSAMLAQALKSIGGQQQTSAAGTGENLLAEALLQNAYRKQMQPQQPAAQPDPAALAMQANTGIMPSGYGSDGTNLSAMMQSSQGGQGGFMNGLAGMGSKLPGLFGGG